MLTVGPGILWENWKNLENAHCTIWNMAKKKKKTEKCWKWEMHTIEPEIWQETWKNLKKETHTLEYRVYGEKT